jgi:S-DNA-T family DNA segregation ATPase FtsK/SpoIIIE
MEREANVLRARYCLEGWRSPAADSKLPITTAERHLAGFDRVHGGQIFPRAPGSTDTATITLDNPGGLIVVELPNQRRVPLRLSAFIADAYEDEFGKFQAGRRLLFPAGITSRGEATWHDLAEMPHLLIAGTTGSGKSVFLNSLITSLIMRNYPHELQLVLVDPKRGVEFGPYESLPHLFLPNAYTAAAAVSHLYSVSREMERRYTEFKKANVRSIEDYPGFLSRIVLVIDELAALFDEDDMRDVQGQIIHLAQQGRAAGIHLVLATQRPSHDVVTGRIKANFPARIGMLTATGIDSKVILDRTGAEKLLGRGDSIFRVPGYTDQRIQTCLVTQGEIDRVVGAWSEEAT